MLKAHEQSHLAQSSACFVVPDGVVSDSAASVWFSSSFSRCKQLIGDEEIKQIKGLVWRCCRNQIGAIGVCYGRKGGNLPPQAEAMSLYQANNIGRMRIYDPDQKILQALRGSNIELILDLPKDNLQDLIDPAKAGDWAQASFVLLAVQNVYNAIAIANLQGQIKVSTAIDTTLLGKSSSPSKGIFNLEASSYITRIIQFLAQNRAPFLANEYPYFAYTDYTVQIDIAFALFKALGVVVQDGQYQCRNLFDTITDALYAALEKASEHPRIWRLLYGQIGGHWKEIPHLLWKM
ncbi:hypothetical protein Patl1_29534 [Pistacia atlantica]|uniref:Uncharacterized protein n=1 Tax=Pistacia atlantica TaxID=434234 RepID=A0ACC1AAR9_9ROSI|nr:hypothetical protein Patl1_29534 [Pistacia atlantica]